MYRNKDDRKKLIQMLGYEFKNEQLLLQALTRTSALNEGNQARHVGDFQRLEFIGDKVLNLVISDIVYENHPDWKEGQLTSAVSHYTHNDGPLATIARNLQLDEFLIMGIGEEKNNQARENTKVLSDALEALIGALWVDSEQNYKLVRKFITEQFKPLKLVDFNKEYEEQFIKFASKSITQHIVSDFMETTMPEIYEAEGGGGISLSELFKTSRYKQRATKPLTGVAASLDNFLKELNATETESEEYGNKEDEPEMPSWPKLTTKPNFR